MLASWATVWNSKPYACTQMTLSLCGFGSIDLETLIHLFSTRIGLISLHLILSWSKTVLCSISKQSFNWMCSSVLGTDLLESMWHIMLLHIQAFYHLQSLHGITRAMVSNYCYGNLAQGCLYPVLGVPVTWMLASNGMTATIAFCLQWVRDASPLVKPTVIMTNCD